MRTRSLVALALLLVACGDDSDPAGTGGGGAGEPSTTTAQGTGGTGGGVECDTATPEGFIVCYADAYCTSAFDTCGCSEQDWSTYAECDAFFSSSWGEYVADMQAAGGTYNPACAALYVATIGCFTREEFQALECPACTLFHGSLPQGSACSEDLPECDNGLTCESGVCVSPCAAVEGAACGNTEDCDAYLSCESGTCTAAPSAPSQCADGVCAAESYCADNGLCAPVKPVGSACEWHDECESYECYGSFCVAAFPLICEEP